LGVFEALATARRQHRVLAFGQWLLDQHDAGIGAGRQIFLQGFLGPAFVDVNNQGGVGRGGADRGDALRIAFGADDNRISGAPKWIDNETFDINAITVNHEEVTKPQQFQQLILSLLEDRFQLKFHEDKKEMSAYVLSVAKGGAKMEKAAPDSALP